MTIQAPQGQPTEQAITSTLAGNRLEAAEVDEVVNTYTCDAVCEASLLPSEGGNLLDDGLYPAP